MKRSALVTLLLLFAAAAGHAVEPPPDGGVSASGKIAWELRKTGDQASIWLSAPGRADWRPVQLCETAGWGNLEVTISPDDYWIAVTDGGASLGVHLQLFRRGKGLVYALQAQEVEDQLARLALNLGPTAGNPLDHQYTRIVKWSGNSKYVLLKTDGHGGDRFKIEEFRAVYDLGKKTLSRDLARIDRDEDPSPDPVR